MLILQAARRKTKSASVSIVGTRNRDTSSMNPRYLKSGQSTIRQQGRLGAEEKGGSGRVGEWEIEETPGSSLFSRDTEPRSGAGERVSPRPSPTSSICTNVCAA